MKTPGEFLKAEQIEDCELQVGNVVLLSYPPQVPVKKLSQLLTDFASQSKPQLNIEKMVDGIVDSLGETSKGNDYQIHSIRGERWITHKEIGSGEPLKQWLKSEIEKHIEQSKPEEKLFERILEFLKNNFEGTDREFESAAIEFKKEFESFYPQSKPESVANIVEISDNESTIKSVTSCPTCGSECEIGSGDSGSHYYIPNRIKPVDTKTVDAVDTTFWRRLEMFVSNIQVNDMAGEEEKQYIIHVIESKK